MSNSYKLLETVRQQSCAQRLVTFHLEQPIFNPLPTVKKLFWNWR